MAELRTLWHESRLLRDNPLGDPHRREVQVLVPEGPGPFPCVLALPGFTGNHYGFTNRKWRAENLVQRAQRLMEQGMPPVILVMPDVMTSVGGSQYLDTPTLGPYASWLVTELMPWIESRLPTTGRWGVTGKSSGGYGSFMLSMQFPDRFQALAAHAPDAGFEYATLPDLPGVAEAVRRAGGLQAWWERFHEGGELRGDDHGVLNLVAMSMCYSPEPSRAPVPAALPVDLETGETRHEVMRRWAAFDPVNRVAEAGQALRSMKVWLCCGRRDEFRLQVGARMLHRAMEQAEIVHHYEEHEGGHFKLNDRFELSLPFLAQALSD